MDERANSERAPGGGEPPAAERFTPFQAFVDFASSRVVAAALSLATIVVVTRGVSVSTAGVFVAAISYAILLASFLEFGTGPHLVRQAVHGDHRRHIAIFVWTRAFLTLLVIAIGAIGAFILFPAAYRAPALISLGYVALSVYGVVGPVGQVVGNARPYRIATVVQGVLIFAGVLGLVLFVDEPSASMLVATYVLGGLIATVAALFWAGGHMARVPLSEIPGSVRANLRAVMLLGLAMSAGFVYLRIDQTLVLHYLGSVDSAYYGLASRIILQALIVPASLQMSLGFLFADRLKSGGGFDRREAVGLSRMVLGLGVGLAAAVIALSDLAILVLGGSRYDGAVVPCLILAVSLVPASYTYLVGTSAVMSSRDRAYLAIAVLAMILNVGANVVLTPRYGLEVAAVISTVTKLVVAGAIAWLVGVRGGAAGPWLVVVSVAAIAAAAGLKLAAHDSGDLLINGVVSALLLGAAAFPLWAAVKRLKQLPSRASQSPETPIP